MFETIENVAGMKVVNPKAVWIFGIPPGSVGPLALGSVLECLLGHIPIRWIGIMGMSPRQQTRGQRVRIVDLTVHSRHVTEAESLPVRISVVIAENMLAGTFGNLQILVLLKVLIPGT